MKNNNYDNNSTSLVDESTIVQKVNVNEPDIDEIYIEDVDFLSDDDLIQNAADYIVKKFTNDIDWFYEIEYLTRPYPDSQILTIIYDNFREFLNDVYSYNYEIFGPALRMVYNNLKIFISENIACRYYSVYDISVIDEDGRDLLLGDSMYADSVGTIINYYLRTGKCYGHK